MKLVFLSNYFNHHQAALSDALWQKTGGEFLFVETTPMSRERRELGYPSFQKEYVLPLAGNEELIQQKIREADAVIAGSAPEKLVRQRIRSGKLLLRYAERPLRNGPEPLKYLPRWLRWHWRNPTGKPIYLLCASAYAAGDYAGFGQFWGRAFRWGYFPETREYAVSQLLAGKDPTEILWCGRFLELKHPEAVLEAARKLNREGDRFHLTMIGTGCLEEKLRQMAKDYDLESCTCFPGAKTPEEVRKYMEKAGIFLFTSDRREGWGAVLNEAMNSGCAVVASHTIGAVPYLVKDGSNGLVYRCGDVEMLWQKIRYLLEHPAEQSRLGAAAYATIQESWNGETAAERLLCLTQGLLEEGAPDCPSEGPCSRAEILKEDWFT